MTNAMVIVVFGQTLQMVCGNTQTSSAPISLVNALLLRVFVTPTVLFVHFIYAFLSFFTFLVCASVCFVRSVHYFCYLVKLVFFIFRLHSLYLSSSGSLLMTVQSCMSSISSRPFTTVTPKFFSLL